MSETLSIVVPVYNEIAFAEASLRGLMQAHLPTIARREVIVVDDGSTDGTRDLLRRLRDEMGFVYFEQPQNMGKGAAVRKGFELATGDYVVIHDADLEYDPNDLDKMLEPLQMGKADVVYGSRFVGSEMRRLLFYWHEKGNRFITTLVNMSTNLNFTDVETCYKMFRLDELRKIPLECDRFDLDIELTVKAARHRLRFYEVAIAYNGRTYDQGKKITWKDGVTALYHIVKYTFYRAP